MQKTSPITLLKKRARFLAAIRQFFGDRKIYEVETGMLRPKPIGNPFIDDMKIEGKESYLHTSPEYAMKALLSQGSGSIFQLARCFRDDPETPLHTKEFTMLEWYQVDYDHFRLMEEVEALITHLSPHALSPFERLSYHEAFAMHLGLSTDELSPKDWCHLAKEKLNLITDCALSAETLIFAECVQPLLSHTPTFVYHFPKAQAEFSRIRDGVAERFELFIGGVEIANGYHEVHDYRTMKARLLQQQRERKKQGRPTTPIDDTLLAHFAGGQMPESAGVALGVERLMMVLYGLASAESAALFIL